MGVKPTWKVILKNIFSLTPKINILNKLFLGVGTDC